MTITSKSLLILLLAISPLWSVAQEEFSEPVNHPESCTSIMVGRKASTDGSVMTSHTCDGNYRSWMDIVPARTNERDTTVLIYQGRMHTETSKDMTTVKIKGSIPDVKQTYTYLNTAYPCLNEKQLGIGETTISGRGELMNSNGMFMIEELQKIALERCTTAREAITLMGKLVKEYGYGDSGECLTIADTKEVWHFEIFGEGKSKIGGVWAAQRIPDDHIGVSANISRISSLNLSNKDMFMASENVYDVAKEMKLWDGIEPFKFWKAYSGGKPFQIREYFILSSFAPSLNLKFDDEELPVSVKPDKKISVDDVMTMLSSTYEGTQWDMTQNLLVERKKNDSDEKEIVKSQYANPWMTTDMVNTYNGVKDSTVIRLRNIAVPQCTYSHVIQLRGWLPDAVGGVAWLSYDNPGQSPRFPVFAGTTSLPSNMAICGQHRFRMDAAIWNYRRANKLATIKWGTTRTHIEKGMSHFKTKGFNELPMLEKQVTELNKAGKREESRQLLTNYTSDFIRSTEGYWLDLGDQFWITFARGF